MSKFYIYAKGQWCELDCETGHVPVWREKAEFLYINHKRSYVAFDVAETSSVLKSLQELAQGQRSTVRDGFTIHRKTNKVKRKWASKKKKRQERINRFQSHHCCAHGHRCGNVDFTTEQPIVNKTITNTVEIGIQVNKPEVKSEHSNNVTKASKRRIYTAKTELPERSKRPKVKNKKTENPLVSDENEKELIITEKDIQIVRDYLLKNSNDIDLFRYDIDDNYKKLIFYSLNPWVNVQRCPEIAKLLRGEASSDSQESQGDMSQEDFATKLGLVSRAVAENYNAKKRYKTRNSRVIYPCPSSSSSSNSNEENDKENRAAETRSRAIPEGAARTVRDFLEKNVIANRTLRDRLNKNNEDFESKDKKFAKTSLIELSSETESSDSAFEKRPSFVKSGSSSKNVNDSSAIRKSLNQLKSSSRQVVADVHVRSTSNSSRSSLKKKGVLPKFRVPKRSSVPSGREYSNSEDHIIVTWIMSGNRARQVKGNSVWRELQSQYNNMSGINRSWHSLRNRYLRYILPSLSSLALSHSDVSRLRAAAATGSVKKKVINPAPIEVISAWSKRARPLLDRTQDEPLPKRMLRSSITNTVASPTKPPTDPVPSKPISPVKPIQKTPSPALNTSDATPEILSSKRERKIRKLYNHNV